MENKNNLEVGNKIKEGPWKGFEIVSKYTDKEAVEDGTLFDVDLLIKDRKILHAGIAERFPIKYITTGLLEKGYWNDRCKNAVPLENAGTADRCQSCETWKTFIAYKDKLPCKERTLNIANVLDLVSAALRIFRKKTQDDWFVDGLVELPSGKKQKVYLAQNETERYTLMLPEEY